MSSTGPPGAARPASVIGGSPSSATPAGPPALIRAVIAAVTSANGPAAAVTTGRRLVAASSGSVTLAGLNVAVTSAPCCAAEAMSNGGLESTTSARPSTDAPVEITSTTQITAV